MTETIASIVSAHRSGTADPVDTITRCFDRIRAHNDPALFISLRNEKAAIAEAEALRAEGPRDRPLYGVPVVIKDNIDVQGLPTTAACPAFSYEPAHDATAVAKLRQVGAVIIGKTNLDQFATGLVGVRSPYGVPRNALNPELIPGGSSSGSATAVSAGLVPLALGTDTAGSGRVPAMLNNIVGLKPSLGIVSTAGVVPACRSLDCVSIFALNVDDAWTALNVIAGFDATDTFSRVRSVGRIGAPPSHIRLGVPKPDQRIFFDDRGASLAYERAIARAASLGATIIEIDMVPFYETARLLYEGPWVAERYFVIKSLLSSSPSAIHPVTRDIIAAGARPSAVDAFGAFYKLEDLRRICDSAFSGIDMLMLPTAPTVYTVEQVLASPIELNSRLGTYTNFVNLLDLCGLAVPAAIRDDGMPFGITFLAPSCSDALLASFGRVFHADTGLPLGASRTPQPPLAKLPVTASADEITIAVVGAHLSGMPLNNELRALGARFLAEATTTPDYRLFALLAEQPPKPGLLRVGQGQGSAIAVEIWAMHAEAFGRFVAAVPPPMSIGTVRLADNSTVKGFLVEAEAIVGARDISSFGGWRNFLARTAVNAGQSELA